MQVAYETDYIENTNFNDIIWGLPENATGENIRIISMNVICGTNLAKKDIFGLSDPYAVIHLMTSPDRTPIATIYTRVKKKTLQPVWNTRCYFRVNTEQHYLVFKIFDENRVTRDDFLGEASTGLDSLYTEGDPGAESNSKVDYALGGRSHKSRVRGTITVSILLQVQGFSSDPDTVDGFHSFQVARDLARLQSTESNRIDDEPVSIAVLEAGPSAVDDGERLHPNVEAVDSQNTLPEGWEERQDANGRTFFLNHNNRTTTWERPVAEMPINLPPESPGSPEINQQEFNMRRHISQEDGGATSEPVLISANIDVDAGEALPPGWEARRNVNNRILYINHNNRTTTWQLPTYSGQVGTDEDPSSPSPPSALTTPPQPPTAPPPPPPEVILTVTPSPPQPSEPSESAASTTPSTLSNGRLHPDVPSQSENPLPPGWAMKLAPNGRIFFIDHNARKTSWVDPRTNRENTADSGLGPLPQGWEQRSHSDGRIFFIDHATQSTQWEDPRIQSKAKEKAQALPYSRDYKRKYDYFRSRLKAPENVPNKYEIHVRRNNLLDDSYRFVLSSCKNVELLKTKLWIVFDGETGLDYGGVSREWFYLLSKEIFNPYYGLFEYSATDNYTLQINPNSEMCSDEHLSYFKFIGRVAGMAVYHGKLLDAFFIRPFYKMLLGKKITLQDLESVDSEYHNSLKWLLENDPEILDLTFVIEEDVFGQYMSRELRPNGNNIPVTQANKCEYIDLVIKWRFIDRVQDQMKSFAEGFHDIIPDHFVQMFDERELEYLLCGLGEINVDDWRTNTQYRSGYHDKHVVIQWFWKAVSTFDNEMKARLLQFVTGTSRVPMNGFAELYGSNGPQKFAIERWGNPNQLPRSHTCFNRLDLPPYLSYHELREKLRLAIENTEGFEGVD